MSITNVDVQMKPKSNGKIFNHTIASTFFSIQCFLTKRRISSFCSPSSCSDNIETKSKAVKRKRSEQEEQNLTRQNAPIRLKGRNENTSIQKSFCFDFSAVNYYHHSKETQQRGSEDRSQLYDYFLKYQSWKQKLIGKGQLDPLEDALILSRHQSRGN